jgi:hypothetical protein
VDGGLRFGLAADVVDEDVCARGAERAGDPASDAGTGAGDDRGLSVEDRASLARGHDHARESVEREVADERAVHFRDGGHGILDGGGEVDEAEVWLGRSRVSGTGEIVVRLRLTRLRGRRGEYDPSVRVGVRC